MSLTSRTTSLLLVSPLLVSLLSACGSESPVSDDDTNVELTEALTTADLTMASVVGRWELVEMGSPLEQVILRSNGRFEARTRDLEGTATSFSGTYTVEAGVLTLAGPSAGTDVGYGRYRVGAKNGDLTLRRLVQGADPHAYRFARARACPSGTRNVRGMAYDELWSVDHVHESPIRRIDFEAMNVKLAIAGKTYTPELDAKGRVLFACVPEGEYWLTSDDASTIPTLLATSAIPRIGEPFTTTETEWFGRLPLGWKVGPSPARKVTITGLAGGPGALVRDVRGNLTETGGASVHSSTVDGIEYDPANPDFSLMLAEYEPLTAGGAVGKHATRAARRTIDLTSSSDLSVAVSTNNQRSIRLDWDVRASIRELVHGRALAPRPAGRAQDWELIAFSRPTANVGQAPTHFTLKGDLSSRIAQAIPFVDPAPPSYVEQYSATVYFWVRLSNGLSVPLQAMEWQAPLSGPLMPKFGGQVRNLSVQGRLANQRLNAVPAAPVVSWDAPSGVSPRSYRVTVRPFDRNRFSEFSYLTNKTSMKLPAEAFVAPGVVMVAAISCTDGSLRWCHSFRVAEETTEVLVPAASAP